MNFKKELDKILNHYVQTYPKAVFRDKEVYCQWLAQTYYFVRHSTSLLGYAMPHLHNESLRHHFEHHLSEEERHDALLLKDLEKMGQNINDFEEFHETKAFYHSQYYRIGFEGGTSLLGYILFLEGIAVSWVKGVYEDLKEVNPKAALFMKVHAEEDPHHLEAAFKTIESLSEAEQKHILDNLHYSHILYETMIKKMLAKKTIKRKAA